ncbi:MULTISPECIES: hypothetical protein [Aureimonas]|uniref:hypothetical protein n=1 Tax=Aureimonas TaxID=414371 RepID=UPI0003643167|nr:MULTISPECIES: hypothetical protein [Aureimonas]
MPAKTFFIVQQFERSGKRLIAGRVLDFRKAEEAVARAERASSTAIGVVALQHTVDTETGEVLEDPIVLSRFGDVPAEFTDD